MHDSKESAILEGPQNVGVHWYVKLFGALVGRSRRKARVVSVDRAEENLGTKGLKKLSPGTHLPLPKMDAAKENRRKCYTTLFRRLVAIGTGDTKSPVAVVDGVPKFDGRGVRGRKSHKKAADVMIILPTSVPGAIKHFSSGNWLSRI